MQGTGVTILVLKIVLEGRMACGAVCYDVVLQRWELECWVVDGGFEWVGVMGFGDGMVDHGGEAVKGEC